jgi:hypothetical protein
MYASEKDSKCKNTSGLFHFNSRAGQPRASSDTPSICALVVVAPIVRFNALDIFATPTFLRASDFSSRTSDEVQARLTDFFLAISISVLFFGNRASNTTCLVSNSRDFTTWIQMPTLYNGLADKVSASISAAIRLVREIFAAERLAARANNSISKPI